MARYRSAASDFLPNEHMRLVGLISAHWEILDATMQRLSAEVTDNKPGRVRLLTHNMSFQAKHDLLMAYARQCETKKPELWKQFTKALAAVSKAYSLRNAYVHAKWKPGRSSKLPKRQDIRLRGGKLVETDSPTPLKELKAAADDIMSAGNELVEVFRKVGMLKS